MKNFIFLLFFSFCFNAVSQQLTVSGIIKSAEDNTTIPGATVAVLNPSDSSVIQGGVTDFDGNFEIKGLPKGTLIIQASFVGFQPFLDTISLEESTNLGNLLISEKTQVLGAIEVVAKPTATMQKGDTVQFSAKAYKTMPDASSSELIEKLPGITVEDGKLQANGDDVQVILVDGKPFFGGDVNAALQNLPASVVASIQVFDKKSDKAQLSGFDDGQHQKTINIITKPDKKKGQFGKSTVGLGTNDTYHAGASINFFNDDRRITVTGLSNNVNTVNYTSDPNDLSDANRSGIIKTNSIGINFNDDWGKKIEFNGNYQFANRDNIEQQNRSRQYATSSDSGQIYIEDRSSELVVDEHRFNFKIQYKDDYNTFLIRPGASMDFEDRSNSSVGETTEGNREINTTSNSAGGNFKNYDFFNNLYYGRKFDKKGRSITTRIQTGYHLNKDISSQYAENTYEDSDSTEVLDLLNEKDRTGISFETQVSYTEPINEHSIIELEYEYRDKIDDSDKLTYYPTESGDYSEIDTTLSNTFDSKYNRQEFELGYQYNYGKLQLQLESEFQHAQLDNQQEFPKQADQNRVFKSVLPSARVNYRFSEDSRLEFRYLTWTDKPGIQDLQSVIDNSNPVQLRSGNPDLNQSYYHYGRLRFWSNNLDTERSIYASLQSRFASNLITSSTFIADEPTEVSDGIVLEKGSQFRLPINLNGYFDTQYYMSYGHPLSLLKSNFRIRGGVNYVRRPGMINEAINYSNSHNYWLGLSLSSNISEKLDFNISTSSRYNVVENSIRPSLDTKYYVYTTRIKYRWVFFDGFVYRANLNHRLNTGLSEGYDNSLLLLNMSAGKKFLKNDLAEVSINVYDLLQQNNNAGRNVNELFIEDQQSTVLQRYFMVTFTYNIRHFSPGTSIEDFKKI